MSESLGEYSLSERYVALKRDYADLVLEHSKLKNEFSENYIVESMNDMKKQYDEKEDEITILDTLNNRLKDTLEHLSERCKTINGMLTVIRTKVKDIDRISFKNTCDYIKMYEIESNIKFVQDVVASSIKDKNEYLYL